MGKIAKSVNEGIELVNSMLVGENCDGVYLDWGAVDNQYLNISCKYFADQVGREFQKRGYFVYYQTMGFGRAKVAQGTPICIRISKYPKENNGYVSFY